VLWTNSGAPSPKRFARRVAPGISQASPHPAPDLRGDFLCDASDRSPRSAHLLRSKRAAAIRLIRPHGLIPGVIRITRRRILSEKMRRQSTRRYARVRYTLPRNGTERCSQLSVHGVRRAYQNFPGNMRTGNGSGGLRDPAASVRVPR
jgi:hypothetical protein